MTEPAKTPETPPTTEAEGTKSLVNEGDNGEAKAEAKAEAPAFVPFTVETLKPLIPKDLVMEPAQVEAFSKALNENYADPAKLVGSLLELARDQAKTAAEAPEQAWTTMLDGWKKASETDPVFGGAKLEESLAAVQTVVDEFGDKDFRALLDLSGAGNSPAMIRFLLKVHAAQPGEGKPQNGQPNPPKVAGLEVLYPGLVPIGA